jgi:hypothetical protein
VDISRQAPGKDNEFVIIQLGDYYCNSVGILQANPEPQQNQGAVIFDSK